VIMGGLISSTLLDFFVHPALFWQFGRQQVSEVLSHRRDDESLLGEDLSHRRNGSGGIGKPNLEVVHSAKD
jgi:hypothetical protein